MFRKALITINHIFLYILFYYPKGRPEKNRTKRLKALRTLTSKALGGSGKRRDVLPERLSLQGRSFRKKITDLTFSEKDELSLSDSPSLPRVLLPAYGFFFFLLLTINVIS